MDLSFVNIDCRFIFSNTAVSWSELSWGISMRAVSPDAAIEKAVDELVQATDPPLDLVLLASLKPGESVQPFLQKLAMDEVSTEASSIAERWLYLILLWIYEKWDVYEDPFDVVQTVCIEFDIPPSVQAFFIRQPGGDPPLRRKVGVYLQENQDRYLKPNAR